MTAPRVRPVGEPLDAEEEVGHDHPEQHGQVDARQTTKASEPWPSRRIAVQSARSVQIRITAPQASAIKVEIEIPWILNDRIGPVVWRR